MQNAWDYVEVFLVSGMHPELFLGGGGADPGDICNLFDFKNCVTKTMS